jgi:hypothetical protein
MIDEAFNEWLWHRVSDEVPATCASDPRIVLVDGAVCLAIDGSKPEPVPEFLLRKRSLQQLTIGLREAHAELERRRYDR